MLGHPIGTVQLGNSSIWCRPLDMAPAAAI